VFGWALLLGLVCVTLVVAQTIPTITGGPQDPIPTADSTPSFTFTGDSGDSFQCSVDGAADGDFGPCSSPFITGSLDDGSHTFRVRACFMDPEFGLLCSAPAARAFSVDTNAPDTEITFGPTGLTRSSTSRFEFSGEAGASFQCSVDGAADGDFGPCSSPFTTGSLDDGPHTFRVRAVDAAGN
jgi:hypothetical protein